MPLPRPFVRRLPGALVALVLPSFLFAAPAEAQTTADDGARLGAPAAFATSIAADGGRLFVGRPGTVAMFPMPLSRQGSVHVFALGADGSWTWSERLAEETAGAGAGYGAAVAAGGGVVVVGAATEGTGAAYVYRPDADGANPRAQGERLEWSGATAGAMFGTAVATDGTTILVGAPGANEGAGAVVVFEASPGGEWEEAGVLEGEGVGFGTALAVEGDLAAAGIPGMDWFALLSGGPPPGTPAPASVRVFRRAGGEWAPEGDLAPPSAAMPSVMGAAVAVRDGMVYAGAPFAEQFGGAVYAFAEEGGEWAPAGTIKPAAPEPASLFGAALAADGPDVLVGAPAASGRTGMAYAFRRNETGAWSQSAAFGPGEQFYFYGFAVALAQDFAFLGAPGAAMFEGAGFVFERGDDGWTARGEIADEGEEVAALTGTERECEDGAVEGFGCSEVDLVAFLPVRELGGERGMVTNDLWGWTDPQTGREYAVIGRADATVFVDLSDPANPVYLGELPLSDAANVSLWRDVKVYGNHALVVADNAGAHGMQVFDLTQLRDVDSPPVVFEETARYDGIHSAHNIVVNEETGFAYAVGSSAGGDTCGGGLHMIDVRDPANPAFAGCFADASTGNAGTGYSHDAQCIVYQGPDEERRGREICFGANENALSVADVTDKDNPVALATASYPNIGYVHQGWITDDHAYFYVNDELDELAGSISKTRTLVWDVRDLDDPVLVKEHFGATPSSDHNLYVRGDFMYQANYTSGLRILDVSNPENPEEVGHFDTVADGEDQPGFAGAWSVYPFFESGILIVSSMKEGLFVLRKSPPRVS